MNLNQPSVIQEFSTFWVPTHHPSVLPTRVSDRWLERVMRELVGQYSQALPETWARYYLVLAQADDPQFMPTCVPMALPERLELLITHIVGLHPGLNQPVQRVHHYLVARQGELLVRHTLRHPMPVAQNFLTAYLQPTCWHTARRFYAKQLHLSSWHAPYSLEDCFQMAIERASNPVRLLQNFQFDRPILIRTYAEKALNGILREIIQLATFPCQQSTWRLLRYLSKKELVSALNAGGQSPETITQAKLLLASFREIYQIKQSDQIYLPAPTETQLRQIGERYAQRQAEFNLVEPIAEQNITTQLEAIAQTVLNYRSSDARFSRFLADIPPSSPWADLIQTEQALQVRELIKTSFLTLPNLARNTLSLWFGLELSQREILTLLGDQLGITQQYQLSRQIRRYRATLLITLLPLIRQLYPEETAIGHEPDLNQMLIALDPCLRQYYQTSFHIPLKFRFVNFLKHEKLLLSYYYHQCLACEEIASYLGIAKVDVLPQVECLTQILCSSLQRWLEIDLHLDLREYDFISTRLTVFVEGWLQHQGLRNHTLYPFSCR